MKESYYFSHDSNSRNDEKILGIRAEFGWEGYGIYWVLVEMMFENTETSLKHSSIKGISTCYNIDITVLSSFVDSCIECELFRSDKTVFWSESLRNRKSLFLDRKKKKSEAGKLGMAKRWGKKDNSVITGGITPDNKKSKVKEKKETHTSEIIEIIDYLNLMTSSDFRANSEGHKKPIRARLKEGYAIADFKKVVDNMAARWLGDESNEIYLRPKTLFGNKFDDYLNSKKTKKDDASIPEHLRRLRDG